jgi:hypothetical protein
VNPPSPNPAPVMLPPGETATPTFAPVSRPPSQFTASPTDVGSVVVPLNLYAVSYEVVPPTTPRQATRFELDEVEDLTRLYLEEFFKDEYSTTQFTFLDDFVTRMLTHSFMMGQPLIVNYESIARFNPFTTVYPSPQQLNTVLQIAFSNENLVEYERRLATWLSDGNIFKDTRAALVDSTTRTSRQSSGPSSATIAAAAVAATLVAASLIIYRRRSGEEEIVGKDLNGDDKPSDITVAGETFAGDTYDGTASVSAASLEYANRQQYDEEAGGKASNLDPIAESDDSSVRPLYYDGQMYDREDEDDEDDDDDGDQSIGKDTLSEDAAGDPAAGQGLDLSKMPSFEEVALQEPSYETSPKVYSGDAYQPNAYSDETSHSSESEVSRFSQSQHQAETEAHEVQSLLSFESTSEDSRAPPRRVGSGSLVERPSKKTERRPRTVAEIEALLSTDIEDDESVMTHLSSLDDNSTTVDSVGPVSPRPRTVSEIESLLSGGVQ